MAIYSRNMMQNATYFPPDGQTAFGEVQYGAAQSVLVRWQDKTDLFRDDEGRERVSSAVVYVDQEVAIGGRLGLGTMTDAADAKEIRNVGKTPSLRGDKDLVKAWL